MDIDPEKMDAVSKGIFAPVYPLIARQIISRSSIKRGICVDVGAGPAALSIAVADITDLKIYAMDISRDMCRKAQKNISEAEFEDRIIPVIGNVNRMPFPDNFAHLVVSRGSIPFWDDLPVAFKEIKRILKPRGTGYIGGGFGSSKIKSKIREEINKKPEEGTYKGRVRQKKERIKIPDVKRAIENTGISKYSVINDASGLWFFIKNL